MTPYSLQRARAFAAGLEVDVGRAAICYACLSIVSFPLDAGKEKEALSEARAMTPILWEEGLEEYALTLVRRAASDGVRDADRALADLTERRGRSAVARALVLRLAADLARRTRAETSLEQAARGRLSLAPPELN